VENSQVLYVNIYDENNMLDSGDAAVDEYSSASTEPARCCRDADKVVWW